MSGIEKILEKIRQDGIDKENSILDAARKEAEQMISEAKVKAEAWISEKQKKTEQEIAFLKSQRQSQRKTQEKQMLLQEKRNQLDKSFTLAKEAILGLPLPQYERFLERLLTEEESIGGELFLPERDYRRLEKSNFAKKIHRHNLRLSKESLAAEGGFVIRRGKIIVNRSLSALFSEKKASLEPELAKILFKEEAR